MFSIQVSISGSQCLASKNSQFYLYDGFISKGLSIVVFLSTRSATIHRFFCVQKIDFSKTPSNKLSDHWNNSSQKNHNNNNNSNHHNHNNNLNNNDIATTNKDDVLFGLKL